MDVDKGKRAREESGDPAELPHAKRLHAAADRILLDILDDVGPADSAAAGDLATVMRSFEEEIAALSPASHQPQEEQHAAVDPVALITASSDDLGFLLEASDDDLGLPPTLPPSSDEGEAATAAGLGEGGGQGLGQMWGFDDEAPGYYGALGFGGFDDDVAGGDYGVALDGDLFGYDDVAPSGPSEFSDFSWRPETLPAV